MLKKEFSFTVSSIIKCERTELWQAVTKLKNVNYELMPLLKMTYPEQADVIDIQTIRKGDILFRSCFLLFGFVPVDLHSLRVVEIEDGCFFHEHSHSIANASWKHHRTLESIDEQQTTVTDWVRFTPRITLLGYILNPLIQYLFEHRHQRLAKRYF
jgi:hypothetical protein